MGKRRTLKPYHRKRDFGRTTEPQGDSHGKGTRRRPRFVIQQHAATSLHYDLCLAGGFALTRVARGRSERWLLVKIDDDEADARRRPTSTQTRSVRSGRTLAEIAREEGDGS